MLAHWIPDPLGTLFGFQRPLASGTLAMASKTTPISHTQTSCLLSLPVSAASCLLPAGSLQLFWIPGLIGFPALMDWAFKSSFLSAAQGQAAFLALELYFKYVGAPALYGHLTSDGLRGLCSAPYLSSSALLQYAQLSFVCFSATFLSKQFPL